MPDQTPSAGRWATVLILLGAVGSGVSWTILHPGEIKQFWETFNGKTPTQPPNLPSNAILVSKSKIDAPPPLIDPHTLRNDARYFLGVWCADELIFGAGHETIQFEMFSTGLIGNWKRIFPPNTRGWNGSWNIVYSLTFMSDGVVDMGVDDPGWHRPVQFTISSNDKFYSATYGHMGDGFGDPIGVIGQSGFHRCD